MEDDNLKILKTFDIHTLPNLDVVVLGALERFTNERLPTLDVYTMCKKPLVVGSANAHAVGRILFRDTLARYAEEGDFEENLKKFFDRDCVVIISASGGKHAVDIAKKITEDNSGRRHNLPVWLLTNNKNALTKRFLPDGKVIVFPKNREPYTYNTSTYLSMILSQTKENSEKIYKHLDDIKGYIPSDLGRYSSFIFIVPSEFDEVRSMFRTKFDELFGGNVVGRIFTDEEIKHAKTVVPSNKELIIYFRGEEKAAPKKEEQQPKRGLIHQFKIAEKKVATEKKRHLHISLSEDASYGEVLSVGYFIIGKIQEAHPAYFKENIVEYTKDASEIFNQTINPIVE